MQTFKVYVNKSLNQKTFALVPAFPAGATDDATLNTSRGQ